MKEITVLLSHKDYPEITAYAKKNVTRQARIVHGLVAALRFDKEAA